MRTRLKKAKLFKSCQAACTLEAITNIISSLVTRSEFFLNIYLNPPFCHWLTRYCTNTLHCKSLSLISPCLLLYFPCLLPVPVFSQSLYLTSSCTLPAPVSYQSLSLTSLCPFPVHVFYPVSYQSLSLTSPCLLPVSFSYQSLSLTSSLSTIQRL